MTLQDLHFLYDPVGNVVQIDDASKPTRFFRNQRIDPTSTYTYDTLYQLFAATGREVASTTAGGQTLYVITAQGVRLLHWEHGPRADQWRYRYRPKYGDAGL